ncbi:MAG: response regulator [Pseudomonadota bacterium]
MNRATFLVEDNAEVRRGLGLALEEIAGVQVIGAADSEADAVAWLTQAGNPWDLAVVDVDLREGSGFGVLQSVKARSPAQQVVVLSNHAEPDIRRVCLALGAEQVFHKTLELERFFDFCRAEERGYRIV